MTSGSPRIVRAIAHDPIVIIAAARAGHRCRSKNGRIEDDAATFAGAAKIELVHRDYERVADGDLFMADWLDCAQARAEAENLSHLKLPG